MPLAKIIHISCNRRLPNVLASEGPLSTIRFDLGLNIKLINTKRDFINPCVLSFNSILKYEDETMTINFSKWLASHFLIKI